MNYKIIFVKNKERAIHKLLFKFSPVSAESAGTYLFRYHSIKMPQIQMHGESYTRSALEFYKIGPVQLPSSGMIVDS